MKPKNVRQPQGGIVVKPIIIPGPGGFFPPPGPHPPWPPKPPGPGPYPPPVPEPHPPSNIPLVKVKSTFTNTFVLVGIRNILYAVSNSPQQGDTFKIIPLNNYQIKIKVEKGGFVKLNRDNLLVVDANKENATIFNQYKTGEMEFSIMAPNGYFVRVRDMDNALIADSKYAGSNTTFKFKKVK